MDELALRRGKKENLRQVLILPQRVRQTRLVSYNTLQVSHFTVLRSDTVPGCVCHPIEVSKYPSLTEEFYTKSRSILTGYLHNTSREIDEGADAKQPVNDGGVLGQDQVNILQAYE